MVETINGQQPVRYAPGEAFYRRARFRTIAIDTLMAYPMESGNLVHLGFFEGVDKPFLAMQFLMELLYSSFLSATSLYLGHL